MSIIHVDYLHNWPNCPPDALHKAPGLHGMAEFDEQHRGVVRAALEPAQVLALPDAAVPALTLLGGRQYRLIGARLDPRRTFAHLPRAPGLIV